MNGRFDSTARDGFDDFVKFNVETEGENERYCVLVRSNDFR